MPNGEAGASREHLRPADLRPEPLTAAAGSFARCMADGLRPSHFTFQDPGAVDCAAMFADCVRCTMLGKDDACRRVALRQRHAVDPYAMAWPPRPAYVTQLALQRRLPYQVDQERRTGVRVAVPPLGPRSSSSGGTIRPSPPRTAPTPVVRSELACGCSHAQALASSTRFGVTGGRCCAVRHQKSASTESGLATVSVVRHT
jgi:hypothetical protein